MFLVIGLYVNSFILSFLAILAIFSDNIEDVSLFIFRAIVYISLAYIISNQIQIKEKLCIKEDN